MSRDSSEAGDTLPDADPTTVAPTPGASAGDFGTDETRVRVERYCPICDRDVGREYCPDHGVCTLSGDLNPSGEPPGVGALIGGKLRLESVLGTGSMGTVYRATQLGAGRAVAVKMLRPELIADRRVVKRFYREALAVSQLNHPSIVRMIDFGLDRATNSPFLALELVGGETLRAAAGKKAMQERRAAGLMAQAASALTEAHDKSMVHRDLKPQNMMVETLAGGGEHLRILDFGLTRMLDENATSKITRTGAVLGTPLYMSPEQASGLPIDYRSDLYSLGCILFELVTGRPVFHGVSSIEVLTKHIEEKPPALPDRLPDGSAPSAELRALHARLLQKKPEDRPASADEVARILARIAQAPARSLPSRRLPLLVALAALIVAGLALSRSGPRDESAVPVVSLPPTNPPANPPATLPATPRALVAVVPPASPIKTATVAAQPAPPARPAKKKKPDEYVAPAWGLPQ